MHIYLDQATQKLSSNQGRRIYPEQKDFILNIAVSRFMNQFRPQLGEVVLNDQFEFDKIRTLIKPAELEVYIDGTKEREGFGTLPSDYYHLLEDSSRVVDIKCTDPDPESIDVTKYIRIISFPFSSTEPHYASLILKDNGVEIFNINKYPISTGLKSKEQRFIIVDLILEELRDYEVYWERYGNVYNANSFIFVGKSNNNITLSLSTETITSTNTTVVYRAFKEKKGKVRANRLTRNSVVRLLDSTSYFKSSPRSHISFIVENKLKVIFSQKSIVNTLLINYIRKPYKINLLLNRSSDLPEETHTEICDMAVEILKKWMQDPSYSIEIQDNNLRNN